MRKLHLLTAVVLLLLCGRALPAQNNTVKVLTLDEMFQLAAKNSKHLKLSNSGIEITKKATELVKNSRLPSIGVTLSASYLGNAVITNRDFSNSFTAPMPHFGNSFALEATQVIFAGGAIDNNIEKAELQKKIARINYKRNETDIRFLLTGCYLDLYKLLNQRKVYVKNIETTTLLINQIKAKQEEGMALSNDITRYELMLENIKLALLEIDNTCKILNNQLITTLGLAETTIIQPDSTILKLNINNHSQSDLIKTAEENLPELRASLVNLEIADKNINIAKAEYLPSIALVAANRLDGPITIEVPSIDKNLNYWYIGVGLKYNLSSLFTTERAVDMAKVQKEAIIDAKSLIEEESKLAIQNTFIKYKESFEKLTTSEKSLQLANENYNVINERYLNNLVLITEMLDASNTKLNSELQVENAKINIIFNYFKLKHISGTL